MCPLTSGDEKPENASLSKVDGPSLNGTSRLQASMTRKQEPTELAMSPDLITRIRSSHFLSILKEIHFGMSYKF